MKKLRIFPILIYIAILWMLFSWVMGVFSDDPMEVPYSTVVELIEKGQVQELYVDGTYATLELNADYEGESTVCGTISNVEQFQQEYGALLAQQHNQGILLSYDFQPAKGRSAYDLVLPLLLC